ASAREKGVTSRPGKGTSPPRGRQAQGTRRTGSRQEAARAIPGMGPTRRTLCQKGFGQDAPPARRIRHAVTAGDRSPTLQGRGTASRTRAAGAAAAPATLPFQQLMAASRAVYPCSPPPTAQQAARFLCAVQTSPRPVPSALPRSYAAGVPREHTQEE